MERVIAIGDIHGCFNTLIDLLSKVNYNEETDILVFVGDYIDRGYYSCEVVTYLRKLQSKVGTDRCVCLLGNHEQMAIDAYENHKESLWFYNGGNYTTYSYDQNKKDILDDIRWFKALPLVYDTPEIIFCHAGLTHPVLKDNSAQDLLWGRDWIKTDDEAREKQVVFGHTPSRTGKSYVVATGDICIDAACVFNGSLCALVIPEDGKAECVYVEKHENDKVYIKPDVTKDVA